MARFYFDVEDDGTLVPDSEGSDLPSLTDACEEAVHTMAEIAKDTLPQGGSTRHLVMLVKDEAGQKVFEVAIDFSARIL